MVGSPEYEKTTPHTATPFESKQDQSRKEKEDGREDEAVRSESEDGMRGKRYEGHAMIN